MAQWTDLERDEPAIAAAGQRLLEDDPGTPGVAFLATVSSRGRPRMHPFIPAIVDGALWAFVIESPKQRDLDRASAGGASKQASAGGTSEQDGQYAIHARLGANDEQFLVSGVARRIDSPEDRARIGAAMPYDNIDARHVLYQFAVDRALWTTWETPTSPTHRSWVERPSPEPRR